MLLQEDDATYKPPLLKKQRGGHQPSGNGSVGVLVLKNPEKRDALSL